MLIDDVGIVGVFDEVEVFGFGWWLFGLYWIFMIVLFV